MRKIFMLFGTLIISTSALAFHCPADMKKIDAALATSPKLTAEQLSDVKKLRTKPGRLHLLLTDRLVSCSRELSFVTESDPVSQRLCRHPQDLGCHRD